MACRIDREAAWRPRRLPGGAETPSSRPNAAGCRRFPSVKKQKPTKRLLFLALTIATETAEMALVPDPGSTDGDWQPEPPPIPYAGNNVDVHTGDDKHASYAMDGYAAQSLLRNDAKRCNEADERSAPLHSAGNASYSSPFINLSCCLTILAYDERSGLVLV